MVHRMVMLCVFVLMLAACGDDDGATFTTTSTTTPTSTTTGSSTTTTTTAAATTTAATSTTVTTTTTTEAPAPALFLTDGIGFAAFGDDFAAVTAAAEIRYGSPSSDTGWLPGGFGDYGVCPGTEFRQISYQSDTLTLMFSDVDYFVGGGVRNFIFYSYYSPSFTMLTDGPPASIDVGTTVTELLTIWPGATVVGDDPLFGPSFYYRPSDTGFEGIYGSLAGTAATDVVTFVSGGVGCGE